jgi:predicted AAA+ superfamily ATPase
MQYFKRLLDFELPPGQSAFLWGARKVGKSTFLKKKFPNAYFIDFLHHDNYLKYSQAPNRLREELNALENRGQKPSCIILDEIQKVPELLDEVHSLIEDKNYQFILCGSSARKLKRSGANMLGGRAWKFHMYPLVSTELHENNLDLLRIFQNGLIPTHYGSAHAKRFFKAYIEDYLVQEIQAEGAVRNLPAFAQFIDSLRFCHGELINYTNIARECHVSSKTVQEYFQILIDTLIGYFILPYSKHVSRSILTSKPRFYLFDVGIANHIKQASIIDLKGEEAGRSLEHFIALELIAHRSYTEKNYAITFWRTKSGLEVDFILGDGSIAIEVKIARTLHKKDFAGLLAFQAEHQPKQAIMVCLESTPRIIESPDGIIHVMPVHWFLKQLWDNQIV